jgi:hypothetical protein
METIKSLREQGIKVRVSHFRRPLGKYTVADKLVSYKPHKELFLESYMRENNIPFAPTGGKTVLLITKEGKDIVLESRCADVDNYNKKVGIELALNKL